MTRSNPVGARVATVGPLASRLIAVLHERGRLIFSLNDVIEITALSAASASAFAAKLANRGLVTRLKSGLFVLVPLEFGNTGYIGNPYAVAREVAGGLDYYLSHASAMDIHQITTQPSFVIYVSTTQRLRTQIIHGMQFRMVHIKQKNFFGTIDHWLDKQQRVTVSDLERTIIDGLNDPNYCGGFSEVAKGFWMRRQDISVQRLVEYALRLGVGSVIRRTGYLLDLWRKDAVDEVAQLRRRLTSTYVLLDPGLPASGRYLRRWRLRLNVSETELSSIVKT